MSTLRLTLIAIALSTGLFAEDSLIGKWSCSMSDGDTYGILNFRPDHKFEFRDLGVSGSWSGDSDNFNADFDDSFGAADLERNIDCWKMADLDNQAFPLAGLEALRSHGNYVGSWW